MKNNINKNRKFSNVIMISKSIRIEKESQAIEDIELKYNIFL